jgi:hypothetical protein
MLSSMITSMPCALDATLRPRVLCGELTCLAFLDWSKAYDYVMYHALFNRLAHKGVSGKMWRLIDALYPRCSARASLEGCLSSSLTVHSGVDQGCLLFPFLYCGLF